MVIAFDIERGHTQKGMAKGRKEYPDPLPGAPTCDAGHVNVTYSPPRRTCTVRYDCPRDCVVKRIGQLPAVEVAIVETTTHQAVPEHIVAKVVAPQVLKTTDEYRRFCRELKTDAN